MLLEASRAQSRARRSLTRHHSKEIAFYGGEKIEQGVLQQAYDDLIKHVNYIYRQKIWYDQHASALLLR